MRTMWASVGVGVWVALGPGALVRAASIPASPASSAVPPSASARISATSAATATRPPLPASSRASAAAGSSPKPSADLVLGGKTLEGRAPAGGELPSNAAADATASARAAAASRPEPSDSPYGAPDPAKPVVKAKPTPKPAKRAAVSSKTARQEPARRGIAGAPTESEASRGPESPELAALRAADLELFAPASPPIGAPWPSDLPAPMPIDPSRPVVHASGLPASSALADAPLADSPRDLGWLRALAMPDVPVRWDARVIRYLEYYRADPRGRGLAQAWLKKSGRYGTAMRRALRAQGLPEDLLWVSLAESGFDPAIRSPAGAAGLWQLMPEGARVYGLVIDRWIDERLDPERSTEAAARYLADLRRRFGAWELALAAYNMGYGGLLAAIRKYNTNDYWELCRFESGVPYETSVYVPKIIAMAIVARNFGPFNLDPAKVDPPVTFDQVAVPGGVLLRTIAAAASVDVATIERLNPQLRAGRTPPDAAPAAKVSWSVRVPVGAGAAVTQAVSRAAPDARRYHSRLGDSVDTIARRAGVSRASLVELNAIRSDEVIRPGTVLLLPAPAEGSGSEPSAATSDSDKTPVVVPQQSFQLADRRQVFYRVVTGDSLAEIAAAFAVSADDLCRWNALDPGARLHDGMTLQVFAPASAELAGVLHLAASEVRRMAVGSDEFYSHFEALRGRKRTAIEVQEGDTWEKLGKRYKLTLGQLERINRRWRTEKLATGETVIVYAPVGRAVTHEADPGTSGPSDLPPMVAPSPEDLPSLSGSLFDPVPDAESRADVRVP